MVLFAYDLAAGAIVRVAGWSSGDLGAPSRGVVYGPEVHLVDGARHLVADLETFVASTSQTLSSGLYDYGFGGVSKVLLRATVTTEEPLSGSDSVELGFSADGAATVWLPDSFSSGASYTWDVSSSSSSYTGREVEWLLRMSTSSGASSAKVVSVATETATAESRLEFVLAVDCGSSTVQDGSGVVSALNGLKSSGSIVSWSDPFGVDAEYGVAEVFDVQVLEVRTPRVVESGNQVAFVRLRQVGTVVYGPEVDLARL